MIRESELPKKQVLRMDDDVRMVTSEGDSVSAALNYLAQAIVENYEGIEVEGVFESVSEAISNLLRSVGNNTEDISTLTNSVGSMQSDVSTLQSDVSGLSSGKADVADTAIDSDTQSIYEDLGWEQETGVNTPSSMLDFTGKNMGVLVVAAQSVTALPETITDDRILSNHVVIKAELSNPAAQTADWTVTTTDGSAEISGTNAISGTTNITLFLALKTN